MLLRCKDILCRELSSRFTVLCMAWSSDFLLLRFCAYRDDVFSMAIASMLSFRVFIDALSKLLAFTQGLFDNIAAYFRSWDLVKKLLW